jgi:hypothetical protein
VLSINPFEPLSFSGDGKYEELSPKFLPDVENFSWRIRLLFLIYFLKILFF